MRGSRFIPILVISSLLFTSIVYACSGLNSMPTSFVSAAMDHSATERGPCSKHDTQDICKSVRYQMLSRQASSLLEEITLYVSLILQFPHFDTPLVTSLLPVAGPPGVGFNLVSKLSFPFSNLVLRI